jgi:hypothetical protein
VNFAGGDGTQPLAFTGNLHSDSYSLAISGNGLANRLSDGGGRTDLTGGYGNDVYIVTNAHTLVHEYDGFTDYTRQWTRRARPARAGPVAGRL